MRALMLTMIILVASSSASRAVVRVPEINSCNDRNALQNVAYDARATLIQFYYKGYIQNLADKDKQSCLEGRVLMDDHFAVINKALGLIEKDCMAIDVAARLAAQDDCP